MGSPVSILCSALVASFDGCTLEVGMMESASAVISLPACICCLFDKELLNSNNKSLPAIRMHLFKNGRRRILLFSAEILPGTSLERNTGKQASGLTVYQSGDEGH